MIISVSSYVPNEQKKVIDISDAVRSETLKRCYAVKSYPYKSRTWKNRYYDFFKSRVMQDMK